MLEEIQQTGDIFFPKRVLDNTFSGHQSAEVVNEVKQFLYRNNHYPENLKNKKLVSLDLAALIAGAKYRGEFEERKSEILEAVDNLLNGFRIFVTDLNKEPRIHERIEAAVMTSLYQQLPPISELPDRGMQLSGRKNSEPLIILNNVCQERLYGLPNYLAV